MPPTKLATLGLHIFGASKGESIVLELPSGEWGVVDCYASSLADKQKNSTLQFLRQRDVKRLAFLCLTHPHHDHFRGMSHLLEELEIDHFWRPAVMDGRRLFQVLKSAKIDAKKSGIEEDIADADEIYAIFQQIKLKRQSSGRPVPQAAITNTRLLSPSRTSNVALEVWALAPSTRQTERYEQELGKCFDSENRFVYPLAQSSHNWISMALLIIFGETRIVLGGDVESHGWKDVLEEFGGDNLSSHAVKISHHGSTNGYTEGLWKSFSRSNKPVACVTSYGSQKLPRKEALEHIHEFAEAIYTPCFSAIDPEQLPLPLSPQSPLLSRVALRKELKIRTKPAYQPGRCSFNFDHKGKCVATDIDERAGKIGSSQ